MLFFADVIGEKNSIYTDEAMAIAAGYRSLPAPPTFAIALSNWRPNALALLDQMAVDMRRLLHGEQHFVYFEPICAGDTITMQDEIIDIYYKKSRSLEFFVLETTAVNQEKQQVTNMRNVSLIRH